MIEKQTITAETVTPCFLGGTQGAAEWRAASIRGQLRWWFRAVAGGAWKGDLGRVRAAEDLLFGSTDRASCLRIRTFEAPAPEAEGRQFGAALTAAEIARHWGDSSPATLQRLRLTPDRSNPIHYLGFGPIVGGGTKRPSLPAGRSVCFELVWMRKPEKEIAPLFDHALWAWLHLGGIGGRNRRGFGSLQQTPVPSDRTDFESRVRALLALGKEAGVILPEWTCFTARSRVFLACGGFGSWQEAMTRLGAWMIAFRRRYGFPADSRPGLADRDYTWAAPGGRMRHNPQREIPDRAGFGLPVHFGQQETVTWSSSEEGGDARRASPLLLHVARFGGGWVPVLTHLPAAFLPDRQSLCFKKRPFKAQAPAARHLDIIDRFLDDLAGKRKIVEVV